MIDARTPAEIARDDARTNGDGRASRYRALDTSLGRWTRQDPATFVDGLSLYQNRVSNPSLTDPLGLSAAPQPDTPKEPEPKAPDGTPEYDGSWPFDVGPYHVGGIKLGRPLREAIWNALHAIRGTKRGKEWEKILEVEGRDKMAIVTNAQGVNKSPGNNPKDKDDPKGDKVLIDPREDVRKEIPVLGNHDNELTRFVPSVCRLLAHELGHGITGDRDNAMNDNTDNNEDPVCQELGLNNRLKYD